MSVHPTDVPGHLTQMFRYSALDVDRVKSNEKDGSSWHSAADVNSHATSTLHLENGHHKWIMFGQMHIYSIYL